MTFGGGILQQRAEASPEARERTRYRAVDAFGHEVAARAVELCFMGYGAPSSMPKVGLQRQLRVLPSDIAEHKHTGFELVVKEDDEPA